MRHDVESCCCPDCCLLRQAREERDEARAEVERLKVEAAAWKAHAEAAERFRKSAVAEAEDEAEAARASQVDWFREGFDAGKGEKKEWSDASFRRGAEAMREAAAQEIERQVDALMLRAGLAADIRDLPVPEDKP